MAPAVVSAFAKSPVLSGTIVPLAVRSFKTNQLPGGSTFNTLFDLPSEISGPVGFTAGGPLLLLPSDALAVGASLELGDELVVLVVPVHGPCAACCGAMQFSMAAAATKLARPL